MSNFMTVTVMNRRGRQIRVKVDCSRYFVKHLSTCYSKRVQSPAGELTVKFPIMLFLESIALSSKKSAAYAVDHVVDTSDSFIIIENGKDASFTFPHNTYSSQFAYMTVWTENDDGRDWLIYSLNHSILKACFVCIKENIHVRQQYYSNNILRNPCKDQTARTLIYNQSSKLIRVGVDADVITQVGMTVARSVETSAGGVGTCMCNFRI
jgi:hypothetical protein